MKTTERGPRSDAGSPRQAMKGHWKFHKNVNPVTREPYQSIQDRFDNDIVYQFQILSNGWTCDMLPGLQSFLQTPLLGDGRSYRSTDKKPKLPGRRTSPTLTYLTPRTSPTLVLLELFRSIPIGNALRMPGMSSGRLCGPMWSPKGRSSLGWRMSLPLVSGSKWLSPWRARRNPRPMRVQLTQARGNPRPEPGRHKAKVGVLGVLRGSGRPGVAPRGLAQRHLEQRPPVQNSSFGPTILGGGMSSCSRAASLGSSFGMNSGSRLASPAAPVVEFRQLESEVSVRALRAFPVSAQSPYG